MKTLLNIYFYFIFIIFVRKILGSLLSRLKNRYEFLPRENNIDLLTDDLYDFEFTKILTTSSKPKVGYKSLNYPYESLYYMLPHENLLEDIDNFDTIPYTGNTVSEPYKMFYKSRVKTSDGLFIPRATISWSHETKFTTSLKHKKTFPSYFPTINLRKTRSKVTTGTSKITKPTRSSVKTIKPTFSFNLTNVMSTTEITTTKEYLDNEILDSTTITMNGLTTTASDLRESNLVAKCYHCGLNNTDLSLTVCHKIFDDADHRYRRLRHNLKKKCEYEKDSNVSETGSNRPGCFKRFLDVVNTYSERSCRSYPPVLGSSYASKRLAKLEKLLMGIDEGCVASPEASLTPFSRPISLYLHYHVCVCKGRYCNHSYNLTCVKLQYLLLLFIIQCNL